MERLPYYELVCSNQICSASLLIDDSVENAFRNIGCAGKRRACCLETMDKRFSTVETAEDMMNFNQGQQHELALG